MTKSGKNKPLSFTVKTESREEFFERGRHIAKLLDAKKPLTPHRIISFEDTRDLISFLTEAKM